MTKSLKTADGKYWVGDNINPSDFLLIKARMYGFGDDNVTFVIEKSELDKIPNSSTWSTKDKVEAFVEVKDDLSYEYQYSYVAVVTDPTEVKNYVKGYNHSVYSLTAIPNANEQYEDAVGKYEFTINSKNFNLFANGGAVGVGGTMDTSMEDAPMIGGTMDSSMYAKGGLIVTSIKDIPNFQQRLNDGKITYRGLGMGKVSSDFYKLAGESGTRIKVDGKEYYITDTEFNTFSRGEDGRMRIKFDAPHRRSYAQGGKITYSIIDAKDGSIVKGGFATDEEAKKYKYANPTKFSWTYVIVSSDWLDKHKFAKGGYLNELNDMDDLYYFYNEGYKNTAMTFSSVPDFDGLDTIVAYTLGTSDGKLHKRKTLEEFEKKFNTNRTPTDEALKKKQIKEMYLDYVNNFLTAGSFADHYGITDQQAEKIISKGREYFEEDGHYAKGGAVHYTSEGKLRMKKMYDSIGDYLSFAKAGDAIWIGNDPSEFEYAGKSHLWKVQEVRPTEIIVKAFGRMGLYNISAKSFSQKVIVVGDNTYAKGGTVKPNKRTLDKIANVYFDLFDVVGAESGGELRENKFMLEKFSKLLEDKVSKIIAKKSLSEKDFDYYEDNNYHLLNEFLSWNDYFVTNEFKDMYKRLAQQYKRSNSTLADPKYIVVKNAKAVAPKAPVMAEATPLATPTESTSGKPNYKVNAQIKSVKFTTKSGKTKTVSGDMVLNGAHYFKKGGSVKADYEYFPKATIIEVVLTDGSKIKPLNGYWISKTVKFGTGGGVKPFEYTANGAKIYINGTKSDVKAMYLDYVNNFLTIEGFADYYNISDTQAKSILKAGKEYAEMDGHYAHGGQFEGSYEVVVVSKEAEKDGGRKHKDRFLVGAETRAEAIAQATKMWKAEMDSSDLSIVEVLTADEYREKYLKPKFAEGGNVGNIMSFEEFKKTLPVLHDMIVLDNSVEYKPMYDKYSGTTKYFRHGRRNLKSYTLREAYEHYEYFASKGKEYAKGGEVELNGKYGSDNHKLVSFDLDNLDEFELTNYEHFSKSMPKAEALQILINNVEGDYSQLSEELSEIAEEQESTEYANGGQFEETTTFIVQVHTETGDEVFSVEATDGVQAFHEARYLFKKENPNYKGEVFLSMVDNYAKGGNVVGMYPNRLLEKEDILKKINWLEQQIESDYNSEQIDDKTNEYEEELEMLKNRLEILGFDKYNYAKGGVADDVKNFFGGIGRTVKSGYEKTRDFSKNQIHDQKKRIALEVIDDTKDKVRSNRDKMDLKGAEEIVENHYADGGMVKKATKAQYESYLNDLGTPSSDHPDNGGRVSLKMINKYGTWLRKNDPIAFEVGYNEFRAQ